MTIAINPSDGLRNTSIYPDKPSSGAAARDQIQGIIDQVVNQLNTGFESSLSQNGYQKLPSGLILQWGQSTSNQSGVTTNFPISFPNNCWGVFPIVWDSAIWNWTLSGKSLSSFQAKSSYSGTLTILWFAIGN